MNVMPINKNPEYIEALNALNRFTGELDKLSIDWNALHSEMELSRRTVAAAADPIAEANAMLAGGVASDPGYGARMEEIQRKQHVLRGAIERQREVLNQLTGRLSKEVCDTLKPQHRAIAKKMLTKLQELDAIFEEGEAFNRELSAAGYAVVGLEDLAWSAGPGRIADNTGSPMYYQVKDLQRYLDIE